MPNSSVTNEKKVDATEKRKRVETEKRKRVETDAEEVHPPLHRKTNIRKFISRFKWERL